MEAIVTAPGLHLRARADQSARIKDALNHGDKLTLIGTPNQYNWQWVRVQRTGDVGYVYAPYIRTITAPEAVSKPAVSAPATWPNISPVVPPATGPTPITPEIPSKAPESSTVQPAPVPNVDRNASWDTIIVPTIIIVTVLVALFWTLFAR